jgi:hypothetical protein
MSRSAQGGEFRSDAKDVEFYYCHEKCHYRKFSKLVKQDLKDKKNHKGSTDSVSVADGEFDDSEAYADVLSVSSGRAAVSTSTESNNDNTVLWHMRFGHLGKRSMFEFHKRNLLKSVKSCKLDFCKYYLYRKQRRVNFKVASHTSKGVLDYVHLDVWGSVAVPSKGGAHYFVNFIYDFSRKVWFYFMKHKSEVFTIFKQWKAHVENQTGRRVKYLRSDNRLRVQRSCILRILQNRRHDSSFHSERDSTAKQSCQKDEHNTVGKGKMYEVECRIAKEFLC